MPTEAQQQQLRQLPAINDLLTTADDLVTVYGHAATVAALRQAVDDARQHILDGDAPIDNSVQALHTHAMQTLERRFQPTLRPVINATGVIVHTNLGRALLSESAQRAVHDAAAQYSNLEFNLDTGKRGSRYTHAEALLCDLTGAEAALVVNNNAAALVLLLSALAAGRGVLLSRGELVEIGGGFRIPDIMAQSGAHLVEVGTTNRTRIADYANAIDDQTALLMRVHSSNFLQVGFTESATLAQMANLAHEHGLHFVDDIGSGTLLETSAYGLAHEPTIGESIDAGADLVVFSGDKLLGGPQAGIMIGRADLIAQLKAHPLARAMRADKLCYAALSATLDHYRRGEATEQIPVWQMISMSPERIHERALAWARHLGGEVIAGESTVGGGSLPGTTLPTHLLALDPPSAEAFAARLRAATPAIITRIADGRVLLDPRTVLSTQDDTLLATLAEGLREA